MMGSYVPYENVLEGTLHKLRVDFYCPQVCEEFFLESYAEEIYYTNGSFGIECSIDCRCPEQHTCQVVGELVYCRDNIFAIEPPLGTIDGYDILLDVRLFPFRDAHDRWMSIVRQL